MQFVTRPRSLRPQRDRLRLVDDAPGIPGYRAVLDRYRELGMRYVLALTVLDVATVLGPDAATGLGANDEARAILVELRAAPLVARFDSLLGSAVEALG